MHHQTIHGKPMAFGVLSRTPRSVAVKGEELTRALEAGDYGKLREQYRIRYLVTAASTVPETNDSLRLIFEDSTHKLFGLGSE
jgi:hypothetical protein